MAQGALYTSMRITSASSIQFSGVRWNSTSSDKPARDQAAASSTASASAQKQPVSHNLFTQIYPISKEEITESDVDEWLLAVKKLKSSNNQNATTPEEVYLQELTQQSPQTLLSDEFEPTEVQQAEADALKGVALPLFQHPAIDNFVGLLMKDGKRSKYQKILNRALYLVYLKKRQDPVEILVETLDKLGPLMATRTEKTGFAKNRIVPYPLNQRQRNRYAIKWILEGASKKKSSDYSVRLAEEILATHEGKSAGYDKKAQMHRTAILQRSYVSL